MGIKGDKNILDDLAAKSNLKKQWFYAMQRPSVHPQTWFLSCDLVGEHKLAEVRLKRIRIQALCCSVGVQCDSYPQSPAHWSWQGPRVLPGITPIHYYISGSRVGTLSWFSFPWAQSGDDVEA